MLDLKLQWLSTVECLNQAKELGEVLAIIKIGVDLSKLVDDINQSSHEV